MRVTLQLLFWSSAGLLLYAHAAFPALLRLLALRRRRVVVRGEALPTVSLIVCAANEERHIREKIEDCLRLDYPPDRLEILVVSDGSTDGTNAILSAMAGPRVRAHVLAERGGKARAQNVAASLARHEVLFFTDATTLHPPGTLRALVRNLKRRGLIVLISDLIDDPLETLKSIRLLGSHGHDVIVFHLRDASEAEFPFEGATVFREQVAWAGDKVQSVLVTNDASHPVPVTSADDPGRPVGRPLVRVFLYRVGRTTRSHLGGH